MRNLLIAMLFISCAGSVPKKSITKDVILKGHLVNFTNQVQIEDGSEFLYLVPPSDARMIIPDSMGSFQIHFPVAGPNYFRIGRNVLYLSPGDSMEVFIDYNDPEKATFTGRGSSANLYLRRTPFPKGGSFMSGGRNVKPTPQENIDMILSSAAKRDKELSQLEGVSAEFKRLEKARTKADVINSMQMVQFYGPYMLKLKGDTAKEFVEDLEKLTDPIIEKYSKKFVDASFLKLGVYRGIADQLVKGATNSPDVQKIRDWIKVSALVNGMQRANDKIELSEFSKKLDSIKTISYRDSAKEILRSLLAFGKGDPAVDFTSTDLQGNSVTLSSLKGKIIFVDLWATWCGPCMKEMPYFEKLKEHYKDNSNVAFVSLSIDDNIQGWKNSVQERNAGGYQWQINRTKLNAYNIVGIPRTLIFDRDFKLVDMNGPVPSSKKAIEIIDRLLN